MPLNGLPFILEKTLAQLIDDDQLQSWNIHGKDKFTVVTLRFNMDGTLDNDMDVKYKKAKPSQLKRDQKRASQYKTKSPETFEACSSSKSCENNDSKDVNKLGNTEVLNDNNIDLGACGGDLQQAEAKVDDDQYDSSGESQASADNNSSPEQDIIKCDECGEDIGTKTWFKCSLCDDYDICRECRTSGTHKRHNNMIEEFFPPTHPANGYCHACGLQFYPERTWFEVIHCKECEDYALCFKCNRLGRHFTHREHMEKITLGQYLEIIM